MHCETHQDWLNLNVFAAMETESKKYHQVFVSNRQATPEQSYLQHNLSPLYVLRTSVLAVLGAEGT